MGKDIIFDPDFDLNSDLDEEEMVEVEVEFVEEDWDEKVDEFIEELRNFLDLEIEDDDAEKIKESVDFYFG